MNALFSPLKIRDLTLKNRIFVSPMCQYSAKEGVPDEWHFVHLGSRAVGGAACVLAEATAVTPEGRISPGDTGLWNETQAEAFARIARFVKEQGSVAGIQIAHAGRKASTAAPWKGGGPLTVSEGGWDIVGPSGTPFSPRHATPRALDENDLAALVKAFAASATRARHAGFEVIEIHMAHGYLLHEFLSPLTNQRTDRYGGSFDNRIRFPLEVASAVREAWPERLPLFVRLSASDWVDGGWDLLQSIALSKALAERGVDLVDCSSGGAVPHVKIPVEPGYQVPFAAAIRREAKIFTGAVGLITKAEQAEAIVQNGEADAVLLAREVLRDPYWPLHAAKKLGVELTWPAQYERAKD